PGARAEPMLEALVAGHDHEALGASDPHHPHAERPALQPVELGPVLLFAHAGELGVIGTAHPPGPKGDQHGAAPETTPNVSLGRKPAVTGKGPGRGGCTLPRLDVTACPARSVGED